jgi:hypothetical protein
MGQQGQLKCVLLTMVKRYILPYYRPRGLEGEVDVYLHPFSTSALEGGRSATRPGCFTPGKDPVPIVQEAGWAAGPVWTCAKNLAPTGIQSLDRPARSQSLYELNYTFLPWLLCLIPVRVYNFFSGYVCRSATKLSGFRLLSVLLTKTSMSSMWWVRGTAYCLCRDERPKHASDSV